MSFILKYSLSSCVSFCLLTYGCTSRETNIAKVKQSESLKTGFDINDLTVMFPIPKSKDKLGDLLSANQTLTDQTKLWDEVAFNKVMEIAEKSGEGSLTLSNGKMVEGPGINLSPTLQEGDNTLKTPNNWKIVSFRFDPCAPQDLPLLPDPDNPNEKLLDPTCRTQIRLIAQPLVVDDDSGKVNALDFTAHLIFGFEPTEAKKIARKLLKIKTDLTTGKALGVHPAMTKPGGDTVAMEMRAFLQNTLSAKNLQLIAFMGLGNLAEPWAFFGGQVIHDASGKVTDFKVVPLAFDHKVVGTQVLSFFNAVKDGEPFAIIPNFGITRPNTSQLFPLDGSPIPTLASKIGSQTVVDTLAEIENPQLSALLLSDQGNPKHRDCLSCHTTTQQLLTLDIDKDVDLDVVVPTKFIKSPKRFSISGNKRFEGITGYANSKIMQRGAWDIRNFGYVANGDTASISMRTLNEAIIVTATTNELLGLENPAKALKCDDFKIWSCLLNPENKGNCMQTICEKPRVASVELGGENVVKESTLKLAIPRVPGGRCVTVVNTEAFDKLGRPAQLIPKGTGLSAQGLVATEGVNDKRMAVRLSLKPNAKEDDNLRFIDPINCQGKK